MDALKVLARLADAASWGKRWDSTLKTQVARKTYAQELFEEIEPIVIKAKELLHGNDDEDSFEDEPPADPDDWRIVMSGSGFSLDPYFYDEADDFTQC